MCYTKQASITAFTVGSLSSLALIFFGDPKYQEQNIMIGVLFLFVSFMQLFDYMMYVDPECKIGWNKIAGYLGPLFNSVQPLILFIFILYLRPKQTIGYQSVVFINLVYLFLVLILYWQYLKTQDESIGLNHNQICSYEINGRLSWSWYNYNFKTLWNIFYFVALFGNIIFLYQYNLKYIMIAAVIGIVFLVISYLNYRHHIGEFWCWFVNITPLIILLIQKAFPKGLESISI